MHMVSQRWHDQYLTEVLTSRHSKFQLIFITLFFQTVTDIRLQPGALSTPSSDTITNYTHTLPHRPYYHLLDSSERFGPPLTLADVGNRHRQQRRQGNNVATFLRNPVSALVNGISDVLSSAWEEANNSPQERIFRGAEARPHVWPWMAKVKVNQNHIDLYVNLSYFGNRVCLY